MCTPNFLLGEGVEPSPKFFKSGGEGSGGWVVVRGGLTSTQCLKGECSEREGWPFSYGGKGCGFYIENKLKSEIFNEKKSLKTESFFLS